MQILLARCILLLESLIQFHSHCITHCAVICSQLLMQFELTENIVEACSLRYLTGICIRQQDIVCHLLHLIIELTY